MQSVESGPCIGKVRFQWVHYFHLYALSSLLLKTFSFSCNAIFLSSLCQHGNSVRPPFSVCFVARHFIAGSCVTLMVPWPSGLQKDWLGVWYDYVKVDFCISGHDCFKVTTYVDLQFRIPSFQIIPSSSSLCSVSAPTFYQLPELPLPLLWTRMKNLWG